MSILTDYLELQRTPAHDGSLGASGSDEGHGGPGGLGGPPVNRAAMNGLIMNYLVTEGFKEAAEKFQEEAGVAPEGEMGEIESRIRVRDAIQSGQVGDAIAMVHQMHPELLDDDRRLFFILQQQQLIELIRENRVEEALRFASEQLSERGEEDSGVLDDLERTMALLAFEEPAASPFADLLSMSHRQKVASELNAALLRADHAECTQPRMGSILKLMLWAQHELDKKGVRYAKTVDLALVTGQQAKDSKP